MKHTPLFLTGDAKHLPLEDASVDLIVTHPPYLGIDVERYGGDNRKQINYKNDIKKTLKALVAATKEMERVLSNRGSIWICIGGNKETSMPYRYLVEVLDNTNLKFLGELFWVQSEAQAEERINQSHALWFHFVKDSAALYYNPFAVKKHSLSPWVLPANNMENPIDKILFEKGFVEDAFPEEFPARFIEMFTKPGNIVLDPFGGSGVAMSQAYLLGRKSITNDISEDQTDLAKYRFKLISKDK
jgi:DNA modification methylase